jgi:prepilin-type N-terminal cleavage/methylation domain-containing protein
MNHITQNTKHKKQYGFTLIEVIVTIGIFSVLIYGVTFLVFGMLNNTSYQSKLLDNNSQARVVVANFTNEMRNAVTSATGGYALESATAQQIIFYAKSGSNVNRIRYYLQSGKLYKGVTTPTGNPPVYNLGQEVVTAVQSAMATTGGDSIFLYYNGNYNGTGSALAQPVNVTQVRYITITLKIYLQGSRTSTNTYIITSGGAIRNLKDNL